MKRRLLSVLLMMAMVLSIVPTSSLPSPFVMTANANPRGEFSCGDVDGNGNITIFDALEVLKYLAKLPGVINNEGQGINEQARIASTGYTRGFRAQTPPQGTVEHRETAVPHINDALEILKFLAKLPAYFIGREAVCRITCEWCSSETPAETTAAATTTSQSLTTPFVTAATTTIARPELHDNIVLPNGIVNIPYSGANLNDWLSGGAPATSWEVHPEFTGATPPGITIGSDGRVTGLPTVDNTYHFFVRAVNAGGASDYRMVTLTVVPPEATTVINTTPAPPTTTTPATTTPAPTTTTAAATTPAATTTTPVATTPAPPTTTPVGTTVAPPTTPAATTTTAAPPTTTTAAATTPPATTTTVAATTTVATTTTTVTTTAATTTTSETTTTTTSSEFERVRFEVAHVASGTTNMRPAGFYGFGADGWGGSGTPTDARVWLNHVNPDAEIWYCIASARDNLNGEADRLNNTRSGSAQQENTDSARYPSASFTHPNLNRHQGGVSPVLINNRGQLVNASGARVDTPVRAPEARRYTRYNSSGIRMSTNRDAFTISTVAFLPASGGNPAQWSDVRTRTWIRAMPTAQGATVNTALPRTTNFHPDMTIVSLYSDIYGLMDDRWGIWNDGIDREEWVTRYAALNNQSRATVYAEMDDWLTQGFYPPTLPGNFTRRGRDAGERPAHLEVFDAQGNRHVGQRVGIRTKGGWSRGTFVYEQKTFEIYCREGMGDRSNVLYPLFGEQHTFDGNLMHRYERFRVRNGGSDREGTYMRDEFAQSLARLSGFPLTQTHGPGVVFLNGAYYGLVMLKSPRTTDHWRRSFGGGARDAGFELIGPNEVGRQGCGRSSCGRAIMDRQPTSQTTQVLGDPSLPWHQTRTRYMPLVCTDAQPCNRTATATTFGCDAYWSSWNDGCAVTRGNASALQSNCRGVASWAQVVMAAVGGGVGSSDITNITPWTDARWNTFRDLVDIDNFMHYYALQIYGANCDWPSNNVEMWRYFLNDRERAEIAAGTSTLHPMLQDERWRLIAQDLEFGWGLHQSGSPVANANHHTSNTIHAVIRQTGTTTHVPGDRATVRTATGDDIASVPRFHYNAMPGSSFMMPALMARPEMRAKLANSLSDIVENSHSWTAVSGTYPAWGGQTTQMSSQGPAQAIYGYYRWTIEAEHRRMMGQGEAGRTHTTQPPDTIWDFWDLARQRRMPGQSGSEGRSTIRINELPRNGEPTGDYANTPLPHLIFDGNPIQGGHENMRTFLQNRGSTTAGIPSMIGRSYTDTANTGLGLAWGSRQAVTATISGAGATQGGSAVLNTIPFGHSPREGVLQGTWQNASAHADIRARSSVTGRYHFVSGATVPLTLNPWPGYSGNATGPVTRVGNTNVWNVTGPGTVNITFTRNAALLPIEIVEVKGGDNGYIAIRNNGTAAVNLGAGWRMTDNGTSNNPGPYADSWPFPEGLSLPGGQTWQFAIERSTRPNTAAQTDFNLSEGERLWLYNADQRAIQHVEILYHDTATQTLRRTADGLWRIHSD